jgi:L-ascorbate metabolism protein UlaG (beta-lactamase superfamily)
MMHTNFQNISNNTVALTHIGHATTLIHYQNMWILTDPVLFDKIGVNFGSWCKIGMTRSKAPAYTINELPPIDIILLSHTHMDHWDIDSLQAITEANSSHTHIICPANTSRYLRRITHAGVISEVDRRESITISKHLKITA